MTTWTEHVSRWKDCTACSLHQQRDRICLARGTVPCDVLFVGEAPGASEDAIGQPFVGPAGKLLDQIIERSLPKLVTCALTNLVCCYPREAKAERVNEPEREEVLACRPRLVEFVNVARPGLIVCVGSLARRYVEEAEGVRSIDIVHPAAILRMPMAQKQMAVQKSIVTIQNAVEDVLQSGRPNFTEWGYLNDQRTTRERLRADYAKYNTTEDPDIPF